MTSEFTSTLKQMRTHYASGGGEPFAVPQHAKHMAALGLSPAAAVTPAGFTQLKSAPGIDSSAQVDALIKTMNTKVEAVFDQAKKDLQSFADSNTSWTPESKSQFANLREKLKRATDDVIDQAYDGAETLGENATPAEQNAILASLNTLLVTLHRTIIQFCDTIGQTLEKLDRLPAAAASTQMSLLDQAHATLGPI